MKLHSFLILGILILTSLSSSANTPVGLIELINLSLAHNAALQSNSDNLAIAKANTQSASAYPNPDIAGTYGSAHERNITNPVSGSLYSYGISQAIENPFLRSARISSASHSLTAAQFNFENNKNLLIAEIKLSYYTILRRQAEASGAQEDLSLTKQIHDRIEVKYTTGESPKFDLIRAQTELAIAQRNNELAHLKLIEAINQLQLLAGISLSENQVITGELPITIDLPQLHECEQQLLENNPELKQFQSLDQAFQDKISVEKLKRLPQVTLLVQHDIDPTLSSSRAGLSMTIPLWNQNQSGIDAAHAESLKIMHQGQYQQQVLLTELRNAFSRYSVAKQQVILMKEQYVHQASEARRIAEAAYRYGEKGILEWLDAQRTYRQARNEYIAARFELVNAAIDIDRLRSEPMRDYAAP